MKSIFLVPVFILSCAKSSSAPSAGPEGSLKVTENFFEKYNGCYEPVNPPMPLGPEDTLTFETVTDTCPGSIGSSQLISRRINDGHEWASSSYPVVIWPTGKYLQTANSLTYTYEGPSISHCQTEAEMIQVESYSIEKKDNGFLSLSWTSIHCSQSMGFEACRNASSVVNTVEFKPVNCK